MGFGGKKLASGYDEHSHGIDMVKLVSNSNNYGLW